MVRSIDLYQQCEDRIECLWMWLTKFPQILIKNFPHTQKRLATAKLHWCHCQVLKTERSTPSLKMDLGVTSKLNRRLTCSSIWFQVVVIDFNNRNRFQTPGTTSQPSSWILKSSLTDSSWKWCRCNRMPAWLHISFAHIPKGTDQLLNHSWMLIFGWEMSYKWSTKKINSSTSNFPSNPKISLKTPTFHPNLIITLFFFLAMIDTFSTHFSTKYQRCRWLRKAVAQRWINLSVDSTLRSWSVPTRCKPGLNLNYKYLRAPISRLVHKGIGDNYKLKKALK